LGGTVKPKVSSQQPKVILLSRHRKFENEFTDFSAAKLVDTFRQATTVKVTFSLLGIALA